MFTKKAFLVPFILIFLTSYSTAYGYNWSKKKQGKSPKFPNNDGVAIGVDTSEAKKFNPAKGETASIKYTLTRSAIVKIRVVGKSGRPLYRTLSDWKKQGAGTYTVEWDGKDASGNPIDPAQCRICVIAEDTSPDLTPKEIEDIKSLDSYEYGRVHILHDEGRCREFNLVIVLPAKAKGKVASQVGPILIDNVVRYEAASGIITLKVYTADSFRGYAPDWGFGVRYYADGEMVHEEFVEPSRVSGETQAFEYNLDTTAYQNGEHLITVNICDHHQHEGTVSGVVEFEN